MITRILLVVLLMFFLTGVILMVRNFIDWRKTKNKAELKKFLQSLIVNIIIIIIPIIFENLSSVKANIIPAGSDISINTPILIDTTDDLIYKAYYTFNEGIPRYEGKEYKKEILIRDNDVKNGECTIYVELKLFGIIPIGQQANATYTIIPAKKGDISNDGKIDAYDASMFLKKIEKLQTEIDRYDFDGNGEITNDDAEIILEYYSYVMGDDSQDKLSFDEYIMFTK